MKIVAVTSCPTGAAHAMMAAEAIKAVASQMGHQIEVETQSPAGRKNVLSEGEIAEADVVILATDARLDATRFAGKPLHEVRPAAAIRDTGAVLEAALTLVPVTSGTESAHLT